MGGSCPSCYAYVIATTGCRQPPNAWLPESGWPHSGHYWWQLVPGRMHHGHNIAPKWPPTRQSCKQRCKFWKPKMCTTRAEARWRSQLPPKLGQMLSSRYHKSSLALKRDQFVSRPASSAFSQPQRLCQTEGPRDGHYKKDLYASLS
ncbi:hypothetical protein ABBQ32_002509 [Trebouxia sp. C0010 RCD-2024]